MTSKNRTYEVLQKFVKNDRLNEDYLNKCIIDGFNDMLITDERFYKACNNRSSKSLVWTIFQELTNYELSQIVNVHKHVCTSQQLKDFLNDYGNGYDSLKQSLEYVDNYKILID